MIFSIFLIIIFIGTALTVIFVFLDFSSSADIGQFYVDFQSEVDRAWRSSQTSKSFSLDLDKDITMVCFANLSAPITGDDAVYREIQQYEFESYNMFMFPPSAAGDLDVKTIEHIDLARITEFDNPKCFENPGEVMISKGIRSRLVMIS